MVGDRLLLGAVNLRSALVAELIPTESYRRYSCLSQPSDDRLSSLYHIGCVQGIRSKKENWLVQLTNCDRRWPARPLFVGIWLLRNGCPSDDMQNHVAFAEFIMGGLIQLLLLLVLSTLAFGYCCGSHHLEERSQPHEDGGIELANVLVIISCFVFLTVTLPLHYLQAVRTQSIRMDGKVHGVNRASYAASE
ncbi:hypothetical protein BCR34DRAFT_593410 [Clohesyomyces aquaticus]|uniref:Uncharacterized protein n=1 Tax=Clohesyomyces aquaticus TaxID=1231657 RepID=A0A1Y1YI78_9PLEO|nr:hypothetical protein BCR34DRAFT_593410 [Clohesyomyces aquaticus]